MKVMKTASVLLFSVIISLIGFFMIGSSKILNLPGLLVVIVGFAGFIGTFLHADTCVFRKRRD